MSFQQDITTIQKPTIMKHYLFVFSICLLPCWLLSQSVGINNTSPDPSAVLDVTSTTQGMLVPRMTTAQRISITNPGTGLLVFDLTTNSFWFKGSSIWTELVDSSNAAVHKSGNNFFIAAGGGYVGVGTESPTQKLDVNGSANITGGLAVAGLAVAGVAAIGGVAAFAGAASFGGAVGIGTTTPSADLDVNGDTKVSGSLAVGALGVGGIIGAAGVAAFGGAVGIGTATPSADLDVQGDAKVSGALTAGAFGVGGIVGAAGVAAFGGAVGVGTSIPSPSASLEISSNDKGFLKPRMSSAERLAIQNPAEGLEVYDTDTDSPWYRDANEWKEVRHDSIVNVEVYRNGADRIYMALNDSVGIGTNAPNYKLQVATDGDEYGIAQTSNAVTVSTHIANGNEGGIGTRTNHPFSLFANNGEDQLVLTPSGNIGIGTDNPHSPLQLSNTPANRKIVLLEDANNDNEFTGFGCDGNAMRYQVNDTTSDHVFYAGINSANSKELFRITGDARIGVSVPSPQNTMDVHGGNAARTGTHPTNRTLYVTDDMDDASNGIEFRSSDATQGIGFGKNTIYAAGSNTNQNLGLSAKGTTGRVDFTTNGITRMAIDGAGNVGIGTSSANAPLQFFNAPANRKVVLNEVANNDNQFDGIGTSSNAMRYQVASNTDNHIFYAATSSTTSDELMRITGSGNVGIGTQTPAQKLQVQGSAYVTDKIGIGVQTPNAALQLPNTIANRKVVMWETANNDNQYFGLGINTGQMRYQVDAQVSSHVFYAATGPASSNELMRINGNGNVGIGTNSPTQKLQVQGSAYVTDKVGIGVASPNSPLQFTNSVANRKIVLYEGANNDNQFYGLGVNAGQMRYQVDATTANHVFYAATSSGTSNELFRISGNGNVGIGTTTPNSPLQFSNGLANRKVVLYETANNDNQFHGFGVNAAQMRYQVGEITSDHVFYAGNGAASSNELMRVKGNGNVGIGTNNPSEKLDVNGNADISGYVLMGWEVVSASVVIPGGSTMSVNCECPNGKRVIGGSYSVENLEFHSAQVTLPGGNFWVVEAKNNIPFTNTTLTAQAICARIGN